jgi:myo-inositol-1-phosphate synthase
MPQIKVALAGVGNCASSLVQGVHYYGQCDDEKEALGLKHLLLNNYHPRDIKFVCAFDINAGKVGKDLSEAIFAPPNNTIRFADVPALNAFVFKSPVLDGLSESLKDIIPVSQQREVDVAQQLHENEAEILINLLPSGAVKASEWFAEQALKAGCAFVNATPSPIASVYSWDKRFKNAQIPLVGDDLEDQIGATALHKNLLKILAERGVHITETYQLDVGGGTESLDTLERTKFIKRQVKTKSVEAALPYKSSVVAGSMDYVDFLQNRRDSFFFIKGVYFGKAPLQLDMRLSTIDAPNAGSVLIDVIRAVKIALDRKIAGTLLSVSVYAFKSPPQIIPPEIANEWFREFIEGKREK